MRAILLRTGSVKLREDTRHHYWAAERNEAGRLLERIRVELRSCPNQQDLVFWIGDSSVTDVSLPSVITISVTGLSIAQLDLLLELFVSCARTKCVIAHAGLLEIMTIYQRDEVPRLQGNVIEVRLILRSSC